MRLPKPFTTTEIQKRPLAVTISVCIGLLLICTTIRIRQGAQYEARIEKLTDKADLEKTRRIEMYERMIFYKEEAATANQKNDSVLREKTSPYIQQLLPNKNSNSRAN